MLRGLQTRAANLSSPQIVHNNATFGITALALPLTIPAAPFPSSGMREGLRWGLRLCASYSKLPETRLCRRVMALSNTRGQNTLFSNPRRYVQEAGGGILLPRLFWNVSLRAGHCTPTTRPRYVSYGLFTSFIPSSLAAIPNMTHFASIFGGS